MNTDLLYAETKRELDELKEEYDIESIIDEFYDHIDDIDNIRCVDDNSESIGETLNTIGLYRDFQCSRL